MTFSLRCTPFTLELRHRFTLANSSRTTTPTLLVELEKDGIIGYGEASMPPYLGETPASAQQFLQRIDVAAIDQPFRTREVLQQVDRIAPGNTAAKAAFDLALHDWTGKKLSRPHWRMIGARPDRAPPTSFTIGIGEPDDVRTRAAAAAEDYRALKIKLGSDGDRAMIDAIREVTDVAIRVDVNEGWRDRDVALMHIDWLAQRGVELVEQPMPRQQVEDLIWLRERSPLPIFADEAAQRLTDLSAVHGVYDGINVKLMKCTGLAEAQRMILSARVLGLRVMLGCMTESSCAIGAAAHLVGMVDYADLDGALLVANDPFRGPRLVDGRILPSDADGIGVTPVPNTF